ncbi:MAG: hypothetical protein R3E39_17485 [Anaerolineae bacterium]
MFNPYFLMAALYAGLAVLGALDTSTSSLNLVQAVNGIRWLRVHFITLGMMTEVIFGFLTIVAAARSHQRRAVRWDIWALLNTGLVILLIGIPMVNQLLILSGGTLIFVAAALVSWQLMGQSASTETAKQPMRGRWFYLAGLAYLLLGVLVGTGLWLGWTATLGIQTPLEVHIHANNWGFLSLVFAGLIVDFYPTFAGRSLAWPRSIRPIFWLMLFGALGLVVGPWFQLKPPTAAGLVAHAVATVWLLANVIKPLWRGGSAWTAGMWHLVTSYVWLFAPVIFAPFVLLRVAGFPAATVEQNAPQALIYGWVLQFGFAIIPFIFRYVLLPDETPRLGGNWLSLIAVHTGGIFLWASIFVADYQSTLHGIAYALWLIALLPIVVELWQILQDKRTHLEQVADAKA